MKPTDVGAATRQPYQAPALVTYGTIASLTHGHTPSLGGGLLGTLEKLHRGGGGGGGIGHRIPRS